MLENCKETVKAAGNELIGAGDIMLLYKKENNMMDYDEPWDDDTVIDPEVWLEALLAMTGDKDRREELVRKISEKTGQIPEHVELIISASINYLANKSRSN